MVQKMLETALQVANNNHEGYDFYFEEGHPKL